MKLIGRHHLHRLRGIDHAVDRWLSCWEAEVSAASWRSSRDVLAQYPNAVEHPTSRFFFPITSTTAKVAIMVNFPNQVALALPSPPDLA
jgi:hypothetical protein